MLNDIMKILEDKKAKDICCYDLENSTIADTIIVVTATSSVHAKTILSELRTYFNEKNISFQNEGENDCGWMIFDIFDIVVHIFTQEMREFYCIDELIKKNSLKSEVKND